VNNYGYLAVVREGTVRVLVSEEGIVGTFRLTAVPPGGNASPESREVVLTDHEDRAIIVRGIAQDGWIRAATVSETASAMLTLVIETLFAQDPAPRRFPGG
jgi:hypothetical protein